MIENMKKTVRLIAELSPTVKPKAIALRHDGLMIAAISSNQLRVWSTVDGKERFSLIGDFGRAIDWSSDGNRLAVSTGSNIEVFRIGFREVWRNGHLYSLPEPSSLDKGNNSKERSDYDKVMDEAEKGILCIKWNNDDTYIAVAQSNSDVYHHYTDGMVKVWDTHQREIHWIIHSAGYISTLNWLLGQNEFISINTWEDGPMGQSGSGVTRWDMREKSKKWHHDTEDSPVHTLSVETTLALLVDQDGVTIVDVEDLQVHCAIKPVNGIVKVAALSEAQSLLAIGLEDGIIELWDYTSKTLLCNLNQKQESASHLVWSKSGSTLAGIDDNGRISIWRVSTPIHVHLHTLSRKDKAMNLIRVGKQIINLDNVALFRESGNELEIVYSENHTEYLYGQEAKVLLDWIKTISKNIESNLLLLDEDLNNYVNKNSKSTTQAELEDDDIPF